MGTQFFWFYDVLVAAILLGITFKCYKKGFISSMVGLVAALAAFIVGVFLSGIIANAIYDGIIKERIGGYIDDSISGSPGIEVLGSLSAVDTSKVRISGVEVSQIDTTPDPAGKITVDLSNVDLSRIGIAEADLEMLGINSENLANVNAGKVNITAAELSGNSFEDLILSKVIAGTLQNTENFAEIEQAAELLGGYLGGVIPDGDISATVSEVLVSVINSDGGDITGVLLDNLIAPAIIMPLRTVIFFILFILIGIGLSILSRALSLVNKIPGVGKLNHFLGIIMGLLQSAVIIFIVCITVNIIISLTGNTIIFLNTMTIEESFIFRHIYNFDLINFTK